MTASTMTSRALFLALLLTLGMAVVILSALGFEHIGHYIPCELCLKERIPYYVGIPVAILAILSALLKMPPIVARVLLGIVVIAMLIGAGLSIYHAGVEWKFWEGPASCTTSLNTISKNANDLLGDLSTQHEPSCSEAALRILGISLAGWNVVATLVLAVIGVAAVRRA